MSVTNLKVPGETNEEELNIVRTMLETEIPQWNLNISRGDLMAKVKADEKETKLSGKLNTNPPKIIYRKQPSILVFIDGEPQLQSNPDWGVEQVVNTPFTIIKNTDQRLKSIFGSGSGLRIRSNEWGYSVSFFIPFEEEVVSTRESEHENEELDKAV